MKSTKKATTLYNLENPETVRKIIESTTSFDEAIKFEDGRIMKVFPDRIEICRIFENKTANIVKYFKNGRTQYILDRSGNYRKETASGERYSYLGKYLQTCDSRR